MNITLSGTKVSMDGHTLAFQKNNLVDSMVITVDTDETWQYKLDVKYPCKDSNGEELYNVIDLTRVGNTCTAILQASMLPFNGKYTMQLRGISGDKVYHTDTFDVWVKYSIDPGKVYDPVPSEFYQIEQAVTEQAANAKQSATESAESATNAAESATKAENAVVHSPIVGENGNWFIWDFEKSEYVDSGKPASIGGGTDLSLGITGAQVGQIAKITAVDTNGKPTQWEPVDMAGGGGGEEDIWEEIATGEFIEDTAALEISTDKKGEPFTLRKMQIQIVGTANKSRMNTRVGLSSTVYSSVYDYHFFTGKDSANSPNIFGKIIYGEKDKEDNITVIKMQRNIDLNQVYAADGYAIEAYMVRKNDFETYRYFKAYFSDVSGVFFKGCKYRLLGVRA